jgi:putative transposase
MLSNYQYKALPSTNQKLRFNHWRRIGQHWYNKQLGDRFDWREMNRCYALPVGLWQSDYDFNAKLLRDRTETASKIEEETDITKLLKLQARLKKLNKLEFRKAVAVEFCYISSQPALRQVRPQPDYFSQKKQLPVLKEDLVKVHWSGELLDYKDVPAWTLQDIGNRVKKAFNRFIVGDKDGKRSGKPRLKSESSFKTLNFCSPDIADCIKHQDNEYAWVKIPKMDEWLRIRLHRPLPKGFTIKQFMLSFKADGLYITFTIEDEQVPKAIVFQDPATWENSMGIDAVLEGDVFLATSEPEIRKLPAVKSFRKRASRLAKVSLRKESKRKGSASRRSLAKREGRIHQQIARARKDHHYKTAHKLVKSGKKVFFPEDLNLKGLTKRNKAKKGEEGCFLPNGQSSKSGLNKSWLDAAFGQFFKILEYIAEKAGARIEKQPPNYTSQILSYRDEFVFTDLSIREYWDEIEKLWVDRDIDSAINLKRVGLGVFPTINRRNGKTVVTHSVTHSTAKEALSVLRSSQR